MAIKISKQVIKLARLATNNPNEHEANSAARRACKMLIEAVDAPKVIPSTPLSNPYYNPTVRQQSYYDTTVWDEIFKRWREKEPSPIPKHKCAKCGKEFDGQRFELPIGPRYCDNCTEQRQQSYTDPFDAYRYSYGEWGGFTTKQDKPKRTLKCNTCKETKETIFQGLPELFECNECQWTAYERARK